MIFHCETPGDAFCTVFDAVRLRGEFVAPRDIRTRELLGAQVVITDPTSLPFDVEGRELNSTITALETCSLIGQTPADTQQQFFNKSLAAFQDEDGVQYGNYGARIRGQLLGCVLRLMSDRDSRQAVMTIYDGRADIHAPSKDRPCTLSVQFFIRNDKLATITTMRSNDVWLGLPYDLHQFCALHCAMAQVMGVDPGSYIHQAGSMHLYEKDWHHELGEMFQSDLQHPLFYTPSIDPATRLADITSVCQSMLLGVVDEEMTNSHYERFLVRNLH